MEKSNRFDIERNVTFTLHICSGVLLYYKPNTPDTDISEEGLITVNKLCISLLYEDGPVYFEDELVQEREFFILASGVNAKVLAQGLLSFVMSNVSNFDTLLMVCSLLKQMSISEERLENDYLLKDKHFIEEVYYIEDRKEVNFF